MKAMKTNAARVLALLLCLVLMMGNLTAFAEESETNDPLSLWTEDAEARNLLFDYMAAITEEGGAEYVPVENRVAVFDLDGTLFCETDPNYFDYTLLKYRVLEDPDYKDQASDFEREVALKIQEQNETGASFEGLEVDHGRAVASAFSGMTIEEFNAYIQEFKKQPMPSYEGMNRGDGWYLPMLQVVEYPKARAARIASSCAASSISRPCGSLPGRSSARTRRWSPPTRGIPTASPTSLTRTTSSCSAGTSSSRTSR